MGRFQIGDIVTHILSPGEYVITAAVYHAAAGLWEYTLDGGWRAAEYELAGCR